MIPEETLEAIQFVIEDYMDEHNYPQEKRILFFQESKGVLPARQKILLQQIIRERAKQDGQDIDELTQQERTSKGISTTDSRGQILGVLSETEGVYINRLIQEAYDRREELSSSLKMAA